MSLIGAALKTVLTVPRARDVVVNNLPNDSAWTGRFVTHDSAMAFVPFYAAVRLLSTSIAGLPLIVYGRADGDKYRATDHPLYPLLHDAPNPEMTSFAYRQTMQAHLLTWGNCYSEIEYDTLGNIIGLWPLRPDRMTVVREGGMRIYEYRSLTGELTRLPARKVFHIPGLGFDGLVGYSIITLARQAISLGQSAEEWASRFYANNATPASALKLSGKQADLPAGAKERLKASIESGWRGLNNAHRMAILEEGMDIATIGVPAKDAQFIEVRHYQKGEMATLFGIPPHMLGDVERSTSWGSGIEQQGIGYVTYTLRSWLTPWEQQINKDLLGGEDLYAEFLVDGLLRGDTASRYQAYEIALRSGWMSVNDIRRRENESLLPTEQGDVYYHSQNMMPVEPTMLTDTLGEPSPATTNGVQRG